MKHDSELSAPVATQPRENLTPGVNPNRFTRSSWMKWAVVLLPLGYVWFRLIDNLRLEWATNPQYSYGWVVPFLCIGLLLPRWKAAREGGISGQRSEISGERCDHRPQTSDLWAVALFATLAFLYLPTRLIEAATPEWRPVQWALGIEAVGLTLCAVSLGKGRGWLRQVAFPLCFFFVAIPWPTAIEQPVIQSLTRINSGIVVEVLGWFGIPAMQHGNLIEVSTGTVGVDEACSGIRSFQTSLMVSLFFGEFYMMSLWRRLLLIPAGFVLAMAFNVCRMTFLTVVAAKKGVAAIAQYHDPAGLMITLVCTAGLWAMAVGFREKGKAGRGTTGQQTTGLRDRRLATTGQRGSQVRGQKSEVSSPWSVVRGPASLSTGVFRLGLVLLAWLFAVEVGSELWYRHLESHLVPSPQWSVAFPTNSANFTAVPIDDKSENLLRFDEGRQAAWLDSDGSRWQGFYFNWLPGRVAGYLAKRHTPEICLPAAGREMVSGPEADDDAHPRRRPARAQLRVRRTGRPDVCLPLSLGSRRE